MLIDLELLLREPEETSYKVGDLVALKSNPQLALVVVYASTEAIACKYFNKYKQIERHVFHPDCLVPFQGNMLKPGNKQNIKKIKEKLRKPRALKS